MVKLELTNDELYVLERDLDIIRSNLEREYLSVSNKLEKDSHYLLHRILDNIRDSHLIYTKLTKKLEYLRRSKDE